jgi:hypothetical protein
MRMKSVGLPALTGVMLLLGLAPESEADGAARVVWTHNTVQVRQGSTWVSAARGMSLRGGAYVRTGGNSRAQIHYADGTIVRLGSRSIARIRDLKGKQVDLKKGKAYFKVQKQPQRMQIRTRTAVATVLGTEFLVSVEEKPRQTASLPEPLLSWSSVATDGPVLAQGALPDIVTQITVFEGTVGVSDLSLQNMVNLTTGMMTLIGAGLPPAPPAPVDLNALRQQENVTQEPSSPADNGSGGFARSPVSPDNPQQQVQVNQNSPGQNLNTSPTTGQLEVVIR